MNDKQPQELAPNPEEKKMSYEDRQKLHNFKIARIMQQLAENNGE